MKAYYAPNAKDSSSGESYSKSDSEDVSEQVEYITQKIFKDTGEEEAKSALGTGRNAASESGSESSTDDSDDASPPAKVSAFISPEIKKRKDDASSKNEKFPRSDRVAKGETSKSVNASEDKLKSQKINVQSKKAGQQKEEMKKKELPLQPQQKAGQANPSPRKRKQQTEHAIQKRDLELKSRRTAQTWTPKDELLLASHFLIDMKHGKSFPLKKGDHYWEELHQRLQGRLETDWSKDQIYDKYRRMKLRYDVLKERLKSDDTKLHKYKGAEEEKLFKVFQQLWGRESVESKQKSEKPHKKSPTPSEEEDESSSSEEAAAGEERDHAIEEEDETSEEDDEPVAEKSALEPAGKKAKLSKVSPQQELDQNGIMQNDAELSDHKTVLPKVQGQGHISGSEEFEKALQAASLSLVEESQTKLLVIFKEEQAKTHALIEKIFNEEQAKTHALIEKIVKEFRWFSQLLMTSLPVGNMCAVLPRLLEGFTDSIHSEDSASTSSLQQEWLQQQTREIQVNIQRSQLMQDILRVRQEQLKRQSN